MGEEPEQVLPKQGIAVATVVERPSTHDQTARHEETRAGEAIHQLQDGGRFKRRERQQQQEGGHELRPHKEGQAHPAQTLRPKLDDCRDEVDRPEQRRRNEADHSEQPPGLALRRRDRKRRVGRPSRVRRAARREEAGEHDYATHEVHPVARHVELGKRHVGRPDLERDDEVAEAADRKRYNPEKHHDGAVHGAELVVELRQHDAARNVRCAEPTADERKGPARVG